MDVLQLNSETILIDDVYTELFELDPVAKERLKQALLARAKQLGVKEQFEGLYRAFERQQKEFQKSIANNPQNNNSNVISFDEFETSYMSGAWFCDESGVIKSYGFAGECIACYHPIIPIKRLINLESNKEKVVIAFNRDGYWKQCIFDKSTISSANKVIPALVDYGVLSTSENARYLVKYFCDIESLNLGRIPIQYSTSKMGWFDDYNKFMPFDNDIIFDSENRFTNVYNSIIEKGSRAKYIELLKAIRARERKEPMLCVATSLASVLVRPCGILPFIFHLYGEAGKGKTIATMLAASIWGNPNEDGYMADPKNTATVFELLLDFLNNLPFICDDMSKVKNFMKNYNDFIYFLCGGTGKNRSNVDLGVSKLKSWRNCSITNAEKPLTSEISNGGELLRVIELQAENGLIFDDGTMGKDTADTLRANYGFLGKEFIEVIKQIGIEKVQEIHADFVQKLYDMDAEKEKEGKQIQPIAVILTADKIFTDYIMHDGVYLDIATCFDLIRSNKAMSDNERAYEHIISELGVHQLKFSMSYENEPLQRWGYIHEDYYLIYPTVFSEIAERGNFNKKMFIDWAVKNGLSMETEKGRIEKKFSNSRFKGRFITIKMPAEDYSEVDDDELPM